MSANGRKRRKEEAAVEVEGEAMERESRGRGVRSERRREGAVEDRKEVAIVK